MTYPLRSFEKRARRSMTTIPAAVTDDRWRRQLVEIEQGIEVADALWKPALCPPPQILADGITVLQARGRSYGSYEQGTGQLCALGALAVAAGQDAEHWEVLQQRYPHWLEPGDAELLAAGRALAQVIRGVRLSDGLSPEELVEVIGDWHDGTRAEDRSGRDAVASPPKNSHVFALMQEAASLAGQARGAA